MADKKKIAITNLGDLRADLGLTLSDMSAAIKPITRQTLGAIESGEFKDAIYMRAAFIRMKAAFGDQFEIFELVAEPFSPGKYFIRYKTMPRPEAEDLDFERLSFQIMDLNNRIRREMKGGDRASLRRQEAYLRALFDTLAEHFQSEMLS